MNSMMTCTVVKQDANGIEFRMEFPANVFEEALIRAYREICPEDLLKPELVLFSVQGLLGNCAKAMDVVRTAVRALMQDNYRAALRKLGIIASDEIAMKPLSSDIGEPLVLLVDVKLPSNIAYEGLLVGYTKVFPDKVDLDKKIASARLLYGVDDDEALVKKSGLYSTVEEMYASVNSSLSRFVDQMNDNARRDAAAKALVKANPTTVSDEEIDAFVKGEVGKLRNQMGDEAFYSQGYDTQGLYDAVRRDVGHVPQLNHILCAIANRIEISITDDDRLKEIGAARAASIKPEEMEAVEETLVALKGDEAALDAIDYQIALNKALDMVVDQAKFNVQAELTLREASPQYLSKI